MPKNTPTRPQTSTRTTSLAAARKVLDVTPTKGDHDTARQLLVLYSDKNTPELFKHLLFQVFWDAMVELHKLSLPKNFTRHWKPFWSLLVAKLRVQPYLATSLRYSWQPMPDEEAQLDAEEKAEADTRAIFDLLHNDALPVDVRNRLFDDVIAILDNSHPSHDLDVFLVAWPRALDALKQEASEETREEAEETHARRTRDQIIARRSPRQPEAIQRSAANE